MPAVKFSDLQIIRKLSSGAFGEIYEALHPPTKTLYAVKVEKTNDGQLRHEFAVYKKLSHCRLSFVANSYTLEHVQFNGRPSLVLIMDLLGPSLEKLLATCNSRFSLKTTLMLADLMITRIEFLHYRHFLHRDIKPDNFVFGLKSSAHQLFLIDFGLSKQYRNPTTQIVIPFRSEKSMVGTARYASLNTHLGFEQGRRDDLESLMYCLLYFMKGRLPWQGLQGTTKAQKFKNISEKKQSTSLRELCEGLDPVFLNMFEAIRHLGYADKPDYVMLRQLIADSMKRNRIKPDYVFDWHLVESKQDESESATIINIQ